MTRASSEMDGGVDALVLVVADALSERDEDVDGDARMLLTRLAAIGAWPSPVIFPSWLSQQVVLT